MSQAPSEAQPVGPPVPDWSARPAPPSTAKAGRYARIEPLDPARHARDLFEANAEDRDGRHWTYLFDEKPRTLEAYTAWVAGKAATQDPMFHAIVDLATGKAAGVAAFMRIDRSHGVIEVGHINFAPRLQRTRQATEAIYLMMARAFDELGYRRFEWKCDHLNAPSRAAALRFGFTFEGIFRNAVVYKGRSRDTAWYSIVEAEWPAIRAAFDAWLDPANFDAQGRQVKRLEVKAAAKHRGMATFVLREPTPADFPQWKALFDGYNAFYGRAGPTALAPDVIETTWKRIHDPREPVHALVAEEGGKLVGLTHYLYHRTTLAIGQTCYLQDLFTLPEARGRGIARGLIEAVYERARRDGAVRVYWQTHETNTTAQRLYDRVAERSGFIVYRHPIDS